MKQCSKCHTIKPDSQYYIKDKISGRLHAQCKDCYRSYRAGHYPEYYQRSRAQHLARARARRIAIREEFRRNMLDFLSDKKCTVCAESDIRTLEFDHTDPATKRFSISQAVRLGYSWSDVLLEIKKCRILCANCHKKHTALQAGWYKMSIPGGTDRNRTGV